MEGRGRHRRLSPFVQPRSLPSAPRSVNVTTPGGSSDEPRREIHGVSDHCVIMRLPSTHDAGDDLAVCNSDMGLQGTGQAAAPPRHCLVNIEGGPRRAQGIVFVGLWRAKKRHYGVAYVLIDRAAIAIDDAVDQRGEAIDQLMNLLSIQRAGKRCKSGEIREQDRDLTSLAVRLVRRFRRRRTRSTRASFDYRREQALAMAERVQSEFFEISIGEMRQDGKINIIFCECGPVLP